MSSVHFSLFHYGSFRTFRPSYSGVKLQPESRGDLRGIETDSKIVVRAPRQKRTRRARRVEEPPGSHRTSALAFRDLCNSRFVELRNTETVLLETCC